MFMALLLCVKSGLGTCSWLSFTAALEKVHIRKLKFHRS